MTERLFLPDSLYLADQVRLLDKIAINDFHIPGSTLMERAGGAAFNLMRQRWPDVQKILLLCGTGNNGGDGFVVARLALEVGLNVQLILLGSQEKLSGDAEFQANVYLRMGGLITPFVQLDKDVDLIVDAVLGTGLEREVTGVWAEALDAANCHKAPVFSLDIPSGLNSDTGQIMGCAIAADVTMTFIGLKRGMFTGEGPACCGDIAFDSLAVPDAVYDAVSSHTQRLQWSAYVKQLKPRSRTQHKGQSGHLLLVGGDLGMLGAISMAGQAAARTGAGLVTIATRAAHAALIASSRPELMCHGVETPEALSLLLAQADTVVIGPGLGESEWGLGMLRKVLESPLPLVMDADALNWLSIEPETRDNWVLTPHPGEAARLLDESTASVQNDRFHSVTMLQKRYGGVVVLKGAGTLICDGTAGNVDLCDEGNPGMAVGGMGDILAGIIGSLIVQGETVQRAARMGPCLHGKAGDLAACMGERGMLPLDLLPYLRQLINPECCS